MKRLYPVLLMFIMAQPTMVWSQGPTTGATPTPDHVALSWTADPATTMTVTWRTDTTVADGFVEYEAGTTIGNKAERAKATSSDLTTELGTIRLFTATLTGLSANTKYTYRAGNGQQWSDKHTFSTVDPSSRRVKFLVFGDSQSSPSGTAPYGIWRTTVHNAYKANPDAQFMIFTGDLVDSGQSYPHWNAWFAAAAGVVDSIPTMPVNGNHESYGSPTTSRPAYLTGQFTLPQNGPRGLKEQIYSYTCGPVHMLALDSQQDEEGYRGMFKVEAAWIDADMAASKATWNIAYFHKGPYEVHVNRKNASVIAGLCPVIDRRHIDLVFNGHDHGIGRTYPIKDGVTVQKPSQGTVYFIDGRSGSKSYREVEKKPWNAFFYNPQDQPNYLVVEATDTKLTIKTSKQDGTLIDTYTIDKKTDTTTDGSPTASPTK